MNGTSFNLSAHTTRRLVLDRRKILILAYVAVAVLLALNVTLSALAAPGDLDTTFSGDGKVITDFFGNPDAASAVAIQSNGKIVAAGYSNVSTGNDDFGLARYNSDGTLDNNFDADGRIITDFFGNNDEANALAIQSDGKIVAAGYADHGTGSSEDFALARYNPNGSLDTTFSGNGKVVTDFLGSGDIAEAVAIQSNGKIVAGGYAQGPSRYYFALARYNPDGSLDTTFGGGTGKVTTDYGNDAYGAGLTIQSDGKIVVAGFAGVAGNTDFALARYNPNGSLDTTFSGDGKLTTDFFGNNDEANALAIQSDGKIVAAGSANNATSSNNFALARYLSDGSLDATFSGKVTTDFGGSDGASAVAIQPNGKIVAVGGTFSGAVTDFALARYNPNGSLDTTFSGDGKVITDFLGNDSYASAMTIQDNGKIVAAGYGGNDFALTRYDGDTPLPPTPTPLPPTQTPGGSTATPIPTTCPIQFTDVLPGSTFYDFVRCMACRGIINGYSSGCETGNPCFRPVNNVTRGQLSKIVSNAAGYLENYTTQTFEDVGIGSTFYQFIERLASRSITNGYTCGGVGEPCVPPTNRPYFRPNANVTRGQTSKIVAIAKGLPIPPTGQQTFQDVVEGSTFWSWVEALATTGAINGYACGNPEVCVPPQNRPYFRPGSIVTRGQASKIVANTFFPNCQAANRP